MTFFDLRKRDQEPEPDEDVEPDEGTESDEATDEDQGAEEKPAVVGPLAAFYQGTRGWCTWCSARIGVGPTWGLHIVALYASGRYSVWITYGVAGAFGLAVALFTPREVFDRAAARMDARDAAREAARAAEKARAAGVPEKEPEEEPTDPLTALMWRLIGDAPGVHLKTLTEVLAKAALERGEKPPSKGDVAAAIEARGITLRPSVRDTRERVNKGVHRNNLRAAETALSPLAPADPPAGP